MARLPVGWEVQAIHRDAGKRQGQVSLPKLMLAVRASVGVWLMLHEHDQLGSTDGSSGGRASRPCVVKSFRGSVFGSSKQPRCTEVHSFEVAFHQSESVEEYFKMCFERKEVWCELVAGVCQRGSVQPDHLALLYKLASQMCRFDSA